MGSNLLTWTDRVENSAIIFPLQQHWMVQDHWEQNQAQFSGKTCFKALPGNLIKMDAVKIRLSTHTCYMVTCTKNKAKKFKGINFATHICEWKQYNMFFWLVLICWTFSRNVYFGDCKLILWHLLFCQHTLLRKNTTAIVLEKRCIIVLSCHSIFNKNHIQYIFRVLPQVLVERISVHYLPYTS